MTDKIQIILEIPHAKLWANKSTHWRSRAPIAKKYREEARERTTLEMESRAIPADEWETASLSLQFLFKDLRKRDLFNASAAMKAAIDGVVDAGLLPDDNWMCLEGGRMTGGLDRINPRVIMIFERIDTERTQNGQV